MVGCCRFKESFELDFITMNTRLKGEISLLYQEDAMGSGNYQTARFKTS